MMVALLFANSGFGLWTTWVALGSGTLAAALVLGFNAIYKRWHRRRLNIASREEDLPWGELLILLEKRNHDRAAAGLPPQEATQDELGAMLAKLPPLEAPRPLELPEDREFALTGGERRVGRRRWGNPTEVVITSPGSTDQLRGLLVNRSTGGFGVLADKEFPPGTLVKIRVLEAPSYVPLTWAEIRHCLKAGKGFILGCEFTQDLPWSVRVWFG